MKKKLVVLFIAVVAMLSFAMVASAVPSGMTVEFSGKPMGKVVFSGKIHADHGFKCKDCHPAIFKMKKGADKITMADIYAGKYCGHCHNGKKAFNPKGNCMKCHQK